MKKIADIVLSIYRNLLKDRKLKSNWSVMRPIYLPIRELTNDETGDIGELLVEKIFRKYKFDVEYTRAETAKEKDWDIIVKDGGKKVKIEIKTATLGNTAETFQHENIDKNRKYDALLILDFAPTDLYCCIAWKKDIKFNKLSRLPKRNKLDTSIHQYEASNLIKFKKCVSGKLKIENDLVKLYRKFLKTEN